MSPLRLDELAKLCGGRPPPTGAEIVVARVSKDTRTLQPGDLYWALRGERHDGNAFAAQAAARGAAGAVLDRPEAAQGLPDNFPVILVEDSLRALWKLAEAWRARLGARVVCVTGSNGKTSTKDFTAAILRTGFPTSCTAGNLNNHIGLPLTILGTDPGIRAAVWEIAMNHAGEIAPLAGLARPEIGIITTIGVAHIENLGSREAIALEKGMLFEALPLGGVAILPESCEFADALAARTRARVERVGGPASRVRAEDVRLQAEGSEFVLVMDERRAAVRLPVPGAHMVANALLAAAAAREFGVAVEDCAQALSGAQPAPGRVCWREIRGVRFLDDSYNANPDSMEAALAILREAGPGRRVAVLGRMAELGAYELEGCRRVGRAAAHAADMLVVVGHEAAPIAEEAAREGLQLAQLVSTPAQAAAWLRSRLRPGDAVLVKGSRSVRMEQVMEEF